LIVTQVQSDQIDQIPSLSSSQSGESVSTQIQPFQPLQIVKEARVKHRQSVISHVDSFQIMTFMQHFGWQTIDLIIAQIKIVQGALEVGFLR